MEGVSIAALGDYLPDRVLTNDELSGMVDTSDEWIFPRTGIRQRRISESENTSALCAKAALKILQKAGITANQVDLIIVATMTPDYLSPSTACLVQGMIGAENAYAFDISAACSGYVYAVSVAEKIVRSGRYQNALVIGGETMSKTLDWTDRRTCVLFGDGAAGMLLVRGARESFLDEDLHSNGAKHEALTSGSMPLRNPFACAEEGENRLTMDGRAVFDFAIKKVPKTILAVTEQAGRSLDSVKFIVPHQANYRIVEAIAKKLNLNIGKFFTNMQYYGNTSAATIPLALCDMEEKRLISLNSGEQLVLTAFGGGLTWGSLLIEL